MTFSDEERMDTLKYRLLAPSTDLGSWGHEYMRHLALEIGQDHQKRLNEGKNVKELIDLANTIVPFFLKHNAEADAVDLLSELEMIERIPDFLDENTYKRVCLYMIRYDQMCVLFMLSTKFRSAWFLSSPFPKTTNSSSPHMISIRKTAS